MAAKDRATQAAQAADSLQAAAQALQSHPLVQRLLSDDALRGNLRTAYESGRNAYGRVNNGKPPHKALMQDKKLQNELRTAANALQGVSSSLRTPAKKRRRRGGLGRMLVVGIVGAGLAIAVSESTRSKVLDMLFGSEEEFDYTSTTAPATPAPETVAAG